jgi:transposase
MDMWDPYVTSTLNHLPEVQSKIVFDKFHIAKHLSEAVDQVRRRPSGRHALRLAAPSRPHGTR